MRWTVPLLLLVLAGCVPGVRRPTPAELAGDAAAAQRRDGRLDESLAARADAVRLDPASHWQRQRLARLDLERGATATAWAEVGDPADAWDWITRGQAERRLGRTDDALASMDHARAADPNLSLAEQERGEILASVSRFEESASAYAAALALDGSATHLTARLAALEERIGRLDSAYERWRRLNLVDPGLESAKAGKVRLAAARPELAVAEKARETERGRAFTATPGPHVAPLPPSPLSPLAVGIVPGVREFRVKFGGAVLVAATRTGAGAAAATIPADTEVAGAFRGGRLTLTWSGSGFAAAPPVAFTPADPAAGFALFNVHFEKGSYWSEQENRAYRGRLRVLERGGELNLVNDVGVEEYLLSVIPSEMPYTWPAEALKAQAVAARAETLVKVTRHRADGYDLCATQHCAVYRGIVGERDASTSAVVDTRGEALFLPSGRPLDAIYAGNCGGWGSSDEAVWNDGTAPGACDLAPEVAAGWARVPASLDERERFLFSRPDAYCLDRGARAAYRWTRSYDEAELSAILDRKYGIGDLKMLRITATTPEGWVTTVAIEGTQGSKTVRRDAIRNALGTIRSDFFTIERLPAAPGVPAQVLLVGGGWGHGAGMCQDGAYGLATRGKDYREILAHYFPAATLKKMYE